MNGDPVDRVERAQILERADVPAARRYEVSPYCWIGSIAVVTLTVVGLLAVDAVGLARLDSVLGELKSQAVDLGVLRKGGSCKVSTTGSLMTAFAYFKEDKFYFKHMVTEEASQAAQAALSNDAAWSEWSDLSDVSGHPHVYPSVATTVPPNVLCLTTNDAYVYVGGGDSAGDDNNDAFSYDAEEVFTSSVETTPFCASIGSEQECTGTLPTAIAHDAWLSTVARHRLNKITTVLQLKTPNCVVAQSEYTKLLNDLQHKMRNPCEWIA